MKRIVGLVIVTLAFSSDSASHISYFSFCSDKIPRKSLRKDGLILHGSFRVQFIMVGKAWQQGHETAGHNASTARNQRDECRCSMCFLLFIQSGTPSIPWNGDTHSYSGSVYPR